MKSCIVFGNGKSLENYDFKNINRDKYDIIGCCLAFRYWDKIDWYPDIYVNVDRVVCAKNTDVKDFIQKKKCKLYVLTNAIKDVWHDYPKDGSVVFIEDLMKSHESVFKFVKTWCSGSSAVLTALDQYDDIHLAGFDCDYIEFLPETEILPDGSLRITKTPETNPNYFFNDYQREGDLYNVPNGTTVHMRSWKELSLILTFIKGMFPSYSKSVINYNDKKSISEHIQTKSMKYFLKDSQENNKKTRVAFCVPTTSRARGWKTLDETYLFSILLPSVDILTNDFDIELYIGHDTDDPLYNSVTLPDKCGDIKMNWYSFNNCQGNPCQIWTELAKRAATDGIEYFKILGDDIQLDGRKEWLGVFIKKLKKNNNIGYSAAYSNNDKIPTQFLIHKKHLEIFNFVFPPQIHNYFCDDFMYGLYGSRYGNWMKEYKHYNLGGQPRYIPRDDRKLAEMLINRHKKTLRKYLNNNKYMD